MNEVETSNTAERARAAVDRALGAFGREAAEVRFVVVVPGTGGDLDLVAAVFARCPAVTAVLIAGAAPGSLRAAATRERLGDIDLARCQVTGASDERELYFELCEFLLAQDAPASEVLVVAPLGAAMEGALAVALDLFRGFSARFLARAGEVAPMQLRALGEHLFAAGDFYHALKLAWAVYHHPQQEGDDPRTAFRILECFSELGCPAWVDRWLEQPAFSPELRAEVRAGLAADLEHDRAHRLLLRSCNLAALPPATAAAIAAAADAPDLALVYVPVVPWKLRTEAGPALARGEYPLLVRLARPAPIELNPPPDAADAEGMLAALLDAGKMHIGVSGLVRHAWAAQIFLAIEPGGHLPGWTHLTFLLEPDLAALALLLETVDLAPLLATDRVHLFVGAAATERFVAHLRARGDLAPPRMWAGLDPALAAGLDAIDGEREQRRASQRRTLAERHTPATVRATLDVLEGDGVRRPLRVFFATSIYTDVLQFAATDLAAAFRELGHETLVLKEQATGEELQPASYTAALLEFQPDFVVFIDHTRAEAEHIVPPELPFVCWIQDELPALKDRQNIARLGSLDLAYAHNTIVKRELEELGYPFVGQLPFAVNPRRFPDAADSGGRKDEVVYATNVVEPPVLNDVPALRALLEAQLGALPAIPIANQHLGPHVEAALAQAGVTPTGKRRHEILYWAFLVARRLDRLRVADTLLAAGVPLALYGRGWDELPRFRPHWRGVAAPGAPMRRIFAEHKVVLHINRECNVHPRLLEGFLAGALVLARHDASDDLPGETRDQFELGKELLLYRSDEELVALVRRALGDELWRSGVVAAAQDRIRHSHTFVARARVILQDLRRRLPLHLAAAGAMPEAALPSHPVVRPG